MKLYRRETYLKRIRGFYHADDIIKVITGVRRCGKSSLMKVIVEELMEQGISDSNIIYIDLDKRGYKSVKTAEQLETIIDRQISINNDMKYLFIDEIQNVHGFEELINGYRTDGGFSIFVTGSNSYLLSGEIMTKLTGRYIEFEMYPLNFQEYLDMKKFYEKDMNPNLQIELNNYIIEGGFPRTVFLDNIMDKRTYVQGVVGEIFRKDIKQRVKIRKVEVFDIVRDYLIGNYGHQFSLVSLRNALKGKGLSIEIDTLKRYINALLDAKILYECKRYDMKSKKSLSGEKKYYLADLSFYYSQNTDNQYNYGPTLENIVYIYARSNDYSVSVGRVGSLECDFILRDVDMNYSYIQVAYTIALSQDTADREYRSLEAIRDNYPKYVATTDYLLQNRNGIKHINVLEFMKNNERF